MHCCVVPACFLLGRALWTPTVCHSKAADLKWTVYGGMQVKLQGIPGIRKVFMRELKTTHLDDSGIYQTENQWVLDTEGVNLLDVSPCICNPGAVILVC